MNSDPKHPPLSPGTPPNEDAFSPDGVDLSLIRWMLSLTPLERLRVLQQHIESVMRLRRAQTRR